MTQRSIRHQAVTLRQVAAHAAVSRQTVSNAINAPHRLEPATLAKVIKAIDELRYRPNRSARSLSTGSAGLIGYCIPQRSVGYANSMMDSFLHALSAAMETVGRHVLLFTAPPGEAGLSMYADLIAQRAVDGFVLSDTDRDDPRHPWLTERDIRFVSFGRTWPEDGQERGSWVDVDGAAACSAIVDGLHANGHERIGFVGRRGRLGAAKDRRNGWRDACVRHGLPIAGMSVACPGDTVANGERAAHLLLDRPKPPTAIVAISDVFALGVMRAVIDRGGRPGTDVAVTGFDDTPLASAVTPALTSVRQPVVEIAATALRLLEAPTGTSEGVLLPGTIVSRDSADITTTLTPADVRQRNVAAHRQQAGLKRDRQENKK
ncbi:MAG TPA: LacI family DNA-binding transcriptional regulator [Actinophytocola sp.]|uniref:LacI family DNA-binding transcriptional regulator n=1 Tax=Actinophytocola sp. TaxID=1872138 RepID=UPI002DBE482B|nr:LacI family DNA-binding transcriptional regulator [Actinophytocola sp.]HEU5472518.1 LacI family DNA-binding transcriptional regulator [Actinophytocola sp.]